MYIVILARQITSQQTMGQPLKSVDCGGYSFVLVVNDDSLETHWAPLSIRMVSRWSNAQQRLRNGRPVGAMESAPRFDSEIAAKTKIYLNLMDVNHQAFSSIHILIGSSFCVAIVIIHSLCEGQYNGQLWRCDNLVKSPLSYTNIYMKDVPRIPWGREIWPKIGKDWTSRS